MELIAVYNALKQAILKGANKCAGLGLVALLGGAAWKAATTASRVCEVVQAWEDKGLHATNLWRAREMLARQGWLGPLRPNPPLDPLEACGLVSGEASACWWRLLLQPRQAGRLLACLEERVVEAEHDHEAFGVRLCWGVVLALVVPLGLVAARRLVRRWVKGVSGQQESPSANRFEEADACEALVKNWATTEEFSMPLRSGERLVTLAFDPALQPSSRNAFSPRVNIPPSLVAVSERALPHDSWSSNILYLQPCGRGLMVPRVIATVYTRVTKLLWDNVTWLGFFGNRRTVSCLVTITKHDVCLGEMGKGGDLSGICREAFKAPATDCIFQPWVPRVVYISRDGAGEIDFNFDSQIKTTKHVYHTILHGNSDTGASSAGQTYQGDKHPALTCLGLINKRNRVLVGDNRGLIYVYRVGDKRSFSRVRQLTFPFPLAKLVTGAQRTSTYLVGLAATSEAARDKLNTGEAGTSPGTSPSTTATSTSTSKTEGAPSQKEYRGDFQASATNAGILRVDKELSTWSTPPVFQALGEGRVLGMAWCNYSEYPLLTTIEEKHVMIHHKVHRRKSLFEAFAVKPVNMLSGVVVWGADGWLAYTTRDEAVLERDPAIQTLSDE